MAFGISTSCLDDGLMPIQRSANGTPATTQSMMTVRGGGVLEYADPSRNVLAPLTDLIGSTIALMDASGALQTRYSYEPFGKPTTIGQDVELRASDNRFDTTVG